MTAAFILYLTFCPLEIVKPNAQCMTEIRPCSLQACVEMIAESGSKYPHKRLVSAYAREVAQMKTK